MTTTPPEPTSTVDGPSDEILADRRFVGHPLALGATFSVEMWERFSFYGMQIVVTVYLYTAITEGGLGFPESAATSVIGAYGGTVYLAAIAGAWVADRLFGAERTLFWSGVVVMAGHIALALLPGVAGVAVGLVLVASGSGGLKTAATTVVGSLYRRDDPRRDAGFSIFYMGINIGALAGPALSGITQDLAGFHAAFGLAAVGMAVGLAIYTAGRRTMPSSASVVSDPVPRAGVARAAGVVVLVAAVVAVGFATGVLEAENLSTAVAIVVGAISLGIFALLLSSTKVDADERSRVLAFIPLWLGSLAFWSLFQQQFTVVVLYFDERLDRSLFGWEAPVGVAGSIEPFFVVVLAPLFALMWTRLGDRAPTTPVKFAIGAGGMGLAFLLFLPWAGGTGNSTPLAAMALILAVFALSELCISPIGLSLSTRIAPAAHRNLMVALFYLTVSLGSALSGTMAGYYSPETEGAYFGTIGGAAVVLGLILAALSPVIRRGLRGVR